MKEAFEHHLKTKIIPFWTNLADYDNGGFFGHISSDHVIDREAPKGLVQQSRFLWSFSALANYYRSKEFRKLADHAFCFLIDRFHCDKTGGFSWLVDYKGVQIDKRIATYGQAFAIYALSEYYMLSRRPEALDLAIATFERIEAIAYDQSLDGYHEEFDQDWRLLKPELLSDGIDGVVFTGNTLIHLLEAYTNLFKASRNESVRSGIQKIVRILENNLCYRSHSGLAMYLDHQYKPVSLERHYGHEIEFSWLLDETMDIIGLKPESWCKLTLDLAISAVKDGWNGRFITPTSVSDSYNHIWWVSSEALVGIWNLYLKTKDEAYRNKLITLHKSIQEDLVDPDPAGEWFWSKELANGSKAPRGMGELWKTPYHNVRAILKLLERM